MTTLTPLSDGLRQAVESLADFVEEAWEGCTPSRGCTGCEALLKVQQVRAELEALKPVVVDRGAIEEAVREFGQEPDGDDLGWVFFADDPGDIVNAVLTALYPKATEGESPEESDCVCDVQGSALSASCKIHAAGW